VEIKRLPFIVAGQPRGYAKSTSVIGAKGLVFLSGYVGVDADTGRIPEGIGDQTKIALEHIKAKLEECGSSLKNILHMRLYIAGEFPNGIKADPKYPESDKVIQEFWRENCPELLKENTPPSETLLGIVSLALPEELIEIEVVAAIL